MFNLFKKKNPVDRLYAQHEKCLADAHRLSTSNRTASDAKYQEAESIMNEIKKLESQ